MIYAFQAYFVAHGASLPAAYAASLQEISLLLESQAFILAMHDAFLLTLGMLAVALVAVLLIRTRKKTAPASSATTALTEAEAEEAAAARAEALLMG
jgi:hypothetical protein